MKQLLCFIWMFPFYFVGSYSNEHINSLSELLGLSSEEFFESYWQNQFLHVDHSDSPTHQSSMFSEHLSNLNIFPLLDNSLSTKENLPHLTAKDVVIVKRVAGPDGEWWSASPPRPIINSSVCYNHLRKGFSLVFNMLNYHSMRVDTVCQNWQVLFGYHTDANLYLTPPNAQAFEAHFDWMEVFVLQIQGSKHWTLYDPQTLSPRPDLIHKPSADSLSPPLATLTLRPGDILYIPSGLIHEAHTRGSTESMHLTIGVSIDPLFTCTGFLLTATHSLAKHHPLGSLEPLLRPKPGYLDNGQYKDKDIDMDMDLTHTHHTHNNHQNQKQKQKQKQNSRQNSEHTQSQGCTSSTRQGKSSPVHSIHHIPCDKGIVTSLSGTDELIEWLVECLNSPWVSLHGSLEGSESSGLSSEGAYVSDTDTSDGGDDGDRLQVHCDDTHCDCLHQSSGTDGGSTTDCICISASGTSASTSTSTSSDSSDSSDSSSSSRDPQILAIPPMTVLDAVTLLLMDVASESNNSWLRSALKFPSRVYHHSHLQSEDKDSSRPPVRLEEHPLQLKHELFQLWNRISNQLDREKNGDPSISSSDGDSFSHDRPLGSSQRLFEQLAGKKKYLNSEDFTRSYLYQQFLAPTLSRASHFYETYESRHSLGATQSEGSARFKEWDRRLAKTVRALAAVFSRLFDSDDEIDMHEPQTGHSSGDTATQRSKQPQWPVWIERARQELSQVYRDDHESYARRVETHRRKEEAFAASKKKIYF